jgi:predicted AAA+ superfamily ATPase
MLSRELATYLSGRYVEIKIYPLSLLELKDFTEEDNIDQYSQEYIKYGGFPSVVLAKDDQMKSDMLKGIYNSILLKDVSIRGNITQIDVLM